MRVDKQIGLEPTPEAYVAQLVAVFREVWRVLRDDGTCWLNVGDSYAGTNADGAWREGAARADGDVRGDGPTSRRNRNGNGAVVGLKPKDLVGIPWRVAFALQADGWYLRADIIWHKPNPMPESVTDRPTKAHEYLFLLAKAERYYYDKAAICEPYAMTSWTAATDAAGTTKRGVDGIRSGAKGAARAAGAADGSRYGATSMLNAYANGGRNRRSVWTIITKSYDRAHFAVMPEKLVEPCVLAGSRHGDLVLDPFLGSGTVGRVATSLGRRFVGCDLNADYLELARERTQVTRGLPLEAVS